MIKEENKRGEIKVKQTTFVTVALVVKEYWEIKEDKGTITVHPNAPLG